ncbi:biotin/lipoyl-containing protein, partial [Kitasatospora sp. NPDC059462]|uniref:biotin/lipoyl-containing protein n=2 Tax=unclassified Kitasatospora TaxID=2633591 RepID=UPI0036739925
MTTEVRSLREFKMPDVGEGLTEAEILSWYVKPGDTVTDGQVVCEVETAKAAVELPIPFTGVVEQLFFPEGATVDVGTVIISVAVASGAGTPAAAPAAPAPAAAAEEAAEPERREVLVGYGPRTGGSQRRARRTTAAAPAPVAAPAAVPAPAPAPVAVPAPDPEAALEEAADTAVALQPVRHGGRQPVIERWAGRP